MSPRSSNDVLSTDFPRISEEKQVELGKAILACEDEAERHRLRTELFQGTIKIALGIVAKRKFAANYREDLRQEALIGLWRATQDWNPDVAKFTTYATRIIKNRVARALHKLLVQDYPLDGYYAQVTGPDGDSTEHEMDYLEGERAWDPEDLAHDPIARRLLERQLATLTEEQRELLAARLDGVALEAIAEKEGVTREAIRLREKAALKKLQVPGVDKPPSLKSLESEGRKPLPNTTLTEADVLEILKRVKSGTSQARVARQLGIQTTTVNGVVSGRTFSSVTGIKPPKASKPEEEE